MKETKDLLQKILDTFKKPEEHKIIEEIESAHKNETSKLVKNIRSLEESRDAYTKKNLQLEAEIRKLVYLENKREDKFQKNNDEKLQLAKYLVELESTNERDEAKCEEYDHQIEDIERQLKMLSKPSYDEIYLELVKGFGVDITKNVCRIKNKKRNDIFRVEIDETMPPHVLCNDIWKKMI